jgi:hypothetical protein
LQQLTRLGHHEAQAVEVDQNFQELRSVERFHGVGQVATLAKGNHEIAPSLCATGGDTVGS